MVVSGGGGGGSRVDCGGKVLFNFPSWYFFAIGLVVIFSVRWSLPPT